MSALPAHVAATLEPEEVRWLEAGNFVALESFTPQTLMRVVAQGIAKSRDPQAVDALVPVTTGGDGGGVFIYTSESISCPFV
jgi:phage terminase large subunit-like protein